jgi:hypothetical protein
MPTFQMPKTEIEAANILAQLFPGKWDKLKGEDKQKNIQKLLRTTPETFSIFTLEESSLGSNEPKAGIPHRSIQSNSNMITTKIQKTPELPFQNIYQWSSELTSELTVNMNDFYWTPQMKTLLRRLQTLENQLVAVIGLQGIGKTAFKQQLAMELQQKDATIYTVKWGNFNLIEYARQYLARECVEMLELDYRSLYPEQHLPYMVTGFSAENQDYKINLLRRAMGKAAEKTIRETILNNMAESKAILIDLPDYDKNNRGQMIRDLREIQTIWEAFRNVDAEWRTNLVFFAQKELYKDHFFYGKPHVFELEPFQPQHLLDFYKQKFQGSAPFNEESLKRVAELSRGIWRRFKKYINRCLEQWYNLQDANQIITIENVNQWIGLEQLVKDMALELQDLFPRAKEKQRNAVIMLRFLQEHGAVKQSELTNAVFGTGTAAEMACSRMLDKLEAHEYVSRHMEGREKTVSLKGVRP